MKKLLTLSNVIKAGAVLLGLIAFFLMFTNQVYVEAFGNRAKVAFDDALFGDGGAVLSFIGYLLILLSSISACLLVFLSLDAKMKKYINFGLAFLLLLGAIFVFCEAAIINGNYGGSAYHLTGGPVIAGILAIFACIALVASEFVPDKKLA